MVEKSKRGWMMKKEKSNTMAEWDQIRREVIERRRDIYTPSKKA